MDCLEAIHARHSYRGAFAADPVPEVDVERILAAAAAAPSGCNTELTGLLLVDAPPVRASVAALFEMPAIRTAPALLLVVGDPAPAYKTMSFEPADTAACVMNAWLAMTALGYASVWIDGQLRGGLDRQLAALLGVPDPLVVRVLMPFGVPDGPVRPPKKKPLAERVHRNHW